MAGETTYFDGWSTTAYKGGAGELCVLDRSHEVSTGELELADVMYVGKVPSGAVYVGGFIATDDLDSNGTPALEFILGDDDDDNGLLVTGSNAGQAAGITTLNGAYVTNATTTSAEKSIILKVGTAAATAAAGTIRVVLYYRTP